MAGKKVKGYTRADGTKVKGYTRGSGVKGKPKRKKAKSKVRYEGGGRPPVMHRKPLSAAARKRFRAGVKRLNEAVKNKRKAK